MRKIIFLLVIHYVFLVNNTYSQFDCNILSPKSQGDIPDAVNYIPDANTPIKYLRVNIHFILKEQGTPGYPGNFTPFSDGNGNSSYTGYDYANDLINMANYRLGFNTQMRMPPGNSTAVLPRQYRYVLNGVFFHEVNNYYYFPNDPPLTYWVNTGEAINVFLNHTCNSCGGQGHANMTGYRFVTISGAWEGYLGNDPSTALWINAQTLNHEIGHNLSLFHTMLTNSGICNNTQEDYCSDTPTRGYIITNYGFDPCCGWGGGINCTNNMMDYTGEDAITPLQLGRVHWTIENEMFQYKTCYYTSSSINITNFTNNMAYIANDAQIPFSSNIVVNNYKGLFINCETFEINGALEIDLGSIFWVNTVPNCN